MANEGVATMLRVQQYVNAIGNPGEFSSQSGWTEDPGTTNCTLSGQAPESNSHLSPIHKSDNKEAALASQSSLDNGTDTTELPADECWLYKCPKRSTTTVQTIEPIQNWLRATFDAPESMFYSSRRNLLTRLEVILASGGPIDAYRFGGSVPSLNQIPAGKAFDSMQRAKIPPPYPSVISSNRRIVSAGSSDSLSTANQSFSIGTYGKLVKAKYSLPPQLSSSSCAQRPDSMTNLSTGTQNLSQSLGGQISGLFSSSPARAGSLDELEPSASRTNIQEIARIQEDNLKADVAAMAAAAAASGRHGSHHSLASLGRRSPDGSYSRVPSASESPHSSNPQLAGPNTNQPVASHVHRPTIDLSSTTFANYMIPEAMKSPTTNIGIPPIPHSVLPHVPRLPQNVTAENRSTHSSGINPSGHGIRQAYSALPQKPTIPTNYHQLQSDVPNSGIVPIQTVCVPPPTLSSGEPRNQFGFRSMRRIPSPQYGPRPMAYLPPHHHIQSNDSSTKESG
ncbi:hypothetical protein D915_011087 [Fasciola hepatica]|uniref:Uncharacterized protein n=1 Tax=Fasciola hepatica TaxID=6192 RepID=A0A4E0QXW8_FASHE|nr:hypothetical protein D915_011087 [Fasciola hepatica]